MKAGGETKARRVEIDDRKVRARVQLLWPEQGGLLPPAAAALALQPLAPAEGEGGGRQTETLVLQAPAAPLQQKARACEVKVQVSRS